MGTQWLAILVSCVSSGSVPTLDDLAGEWIDLEKPLSAHTAAQALDLPAISNFHGSVGSAPGGCGGQAKDEICLGVRPVDMFAINSFELPPYGTNVKNISLLIMRAAYMFACNACLCHAVGCGNRAETGTNFGCGKLTIDGTWLLFAYSRVRVSSCVSCVCAQV